MKQFPFWVSCNLLIRLSRSIEDSRLRYKDGISTSLRCENHVFHNSNFSKSFDRRSAFGGPQLSSRKRNRRFNLQSLAIVRFALQSFQRHHKQAYLPCVNMLPFLQLCFTAIAKFNQSVISPIIAGQSINPSLTVHPNNYLQIFCKWLN